MIYTFYSFKGGVGRSMALANVAELLCDLGLKVLIVDFDLEAPGLERYFDSPNVLISADEVEEKRGLIDLLVSYNSLRQLLQPAPVEPTTIEVNLAVNQPALAGNKTNSFRSAPSEEIIERPFPVEPLETFIHQIYRPNAEGGEIHLLPAGQRANDSRSHDPLRQFGRCMRDSEEFARYAERVRAFPWNEF